MEPPKPPPPLSARPSLSTAAARVVEEERQRQAQKDEEARESRALELEEKLFPRPEADDEFLLMDTVAVAREQLRMQKLVPYTAKKPGNMHKGSVEAVSTGDSAANTLATAGSDVVDIEGGDVEDKVATEQVVEPLRRPPQKVERAADTVRPSIDDVMQQALGVPSFLKSTEEKREKKGKSKGKGKGKGKGSVAKAVQKGSAVKPVQKKGGRSNVPVPPRKTQEAPIIRGLVNPSVKKLVGAEELAVLLEEEDAKERLQSVEEAVKKPLRTPVVEVASSPSSGNNSPQAAKARVEFSNRPGPEGKPRQKVVRNHRVPEGDKEGQKPNPPPQKSAQRQPATVGSAQTESSKAKDRQKRAAADSPAGSAKDEAELDGGTGPLDALRGAFLKEFE